MDAESRDDNRANALLRFILWLATPTGILILLIGPLAVLNSEGFGDQPGAASESEHWRTVSWILMPLGAALSGLAAIGLFALRCRHRMSVQCDSGTVIESARMAISAGDPPD